MTVRSNTDVMPAQREHRRAGEHVLFMAGIRSELSKKGGDALSDLEQGDVDRAGRAIRLPPKLELVASLSQQTRGFGTR
jgi:hypothetical protein